MFSYYGSKSKVVELYPHPKHGKIIEPFAGSARYSLRYFDHDVLLIDCYDVVIKVWHYLQQASPADILGLPEPTYKQSIDNFNLSEGEYLLLSFLVARGVATPRKTVQKFSNIGDAKKDIAKQLYKIKHWKIVLGSYEELSDEPATWFIDPPYQIGGKEYKHKDIDYPNLAEWCKSRSGQVIVCENTKATWLPFYPLRDLHGAFTRSTEAIWSNEKHNFMARQDTFLEPVVHERRW